MSNVIAITPPRRTPKFSGAMIEHAIDILRKAGTDYTHRDDDGSSQVGSDCLAKFLQRHWKSKIRKPQTHLQWEALGHMAQIFIWIEADFEREEISTD